MNLRPRFFIPALALALTTLGCGGRLAGDYTGPDRSETLGGWIEGSWVAQDGATELHITRLPEFRRAWYVERAPVGSSAEPTHQFVWMLVQTDERTTAEHWRLTRTDLALNAWQDPDKLADNFSMYYLRHAPECDIAFRARRDLFTGAPSADCAELAPASVDVTPIDIEWAGTRYQLAE